MEVDYDKSLDEIIKTTQPRRQQKPRFPGGVRRYPTNSYKAPQRRNYMQMDPMVDPNTTPTSKLNVTNLHYGVTESDLEALFDDIGPVRSLTLHYDRSGRSLGAADVIFERRWDAMRAIKNYNGVPLDGRPMRIEFSNTSSTSRLPVKLYVPPIRTYSGGQGRGRDGGGYNRRGGLNTFQSRASVNNASKFSNNHDDEINKKPTLEELDAELEEYVKHSKTKQTSELQ